MLRLESVSKQYVRRGQTVTALHGADVTIHNGDYVAVIGPSGSGKSTLLSVLGGMLTPSDGRVWMDETSLYDQTVAVRSALRSSRMGFVFQTFNLIPYLTALQNVQVPLCLLGMTSEEQRSRACAVLEKFGLAERLHHRPSELSIGQQQRVALARTLVNDPQLILADEPTGNLDPDSRNLVLDALDAARAQGRTVVMVTHDPTAAARASRLLQLRDGILTEISAAEANLARRAA